MIQKEKFNKNLLNILKIVDFSSLSLLSVLFNFPSRYFTLSINKNFLSFEDGSPIFNQGIRAPIYSIMLNFLLRTGL